MIKNLITVGTAVVMLGSYSCKKSKSPAPLPPIDSPLVIPHPDYTALKPGNYWIYQNYRLDSINGDAHPQGTYDSCYVEKDTVIKGYTYHKYMARNYGASSYSISFLRDSLSYTVNEMGRIIFSYENFGVLKSYTYGPNAATPDTLYVTEQMFSDFYPVTVMAGTFRTITFKQNYRFPAGAPYGRDRAYETKYSKGVGIVKKTTAFYTLLPDVYEWRLERFHIEH